MRNDEYTRMIIRMIKRIHREEFLLKIYTYVKVLLDLQGD